ncbi:hypothetical protein IP86_10705 [Rhodopseudomonas sp. AAP120]|nr:hypothetical protein IP86_10705 [Rhodopseudomonas sp. AAP120]
MEMGRPLGGIVTACWLIALLLLGAALWLLVKPATAAACDRRCDGLASFYGSESGTQTASGERFNPEAMTAAHRCLPFRTRLRVTHNGRRVTVTVNDRGPFIRGRVLDLSEGAARAIGITRKVGVGRVACEVAGGPS